MRLAIAISGLPRKVEEGFNEFWKPVIEKYKADVYLHSWMDEEYQKILQFYRPVKFILEAPYSFAEHVNGIVADESLSRPTKPYDVAGNFRGFPLFASWQACCSLINERYDCVIRGRYDLSGNCDLANIDPHRINVSSHHWTHDYICDDNLYVSSFDLYKVIHQDAFDNLITNARQTGRIYFQEKNFTEMIIRKGLHHLVNKSSFMNFKLLREDKLWY